MLHEQVKVTKATSSLLVLLLVLALGWVAPCAGASELKFSYNGQNIQNHPSVGQAYVYANNTIEVDHNQTSYSGANFWLKVTVQRKGNLGRWVDVCSVSFKGSTTGRKFYCTPPQNGVYRLYFKSDNADYKFGVWGEFRVG